jgi:hypothetical protein
MAGPAIDEYTLDLPDSKGNVESPERSPIANPAGLPPKVAARLRQNPSGTALATVATAESLGAPIAYAGGKAAVAGDQPSAISALGGTLGDPATIGSILLLLFVCGDLFLARRNEGSRRP